MTEQDPFVLDKTQVRRAFDRAVATYDAAAVLQHEVADRLVGRLEYIRVKPERILDLGSGTGYCASALTKRYPKARVTSLDIAPGMLAHAKGRTGWFSRQQFVCGDAESLPLADNSFDLVLSSLALQWCLDLDAVFSELQRILRPGGLLLFTTFGPDTLHELRASWRAVDGFNHVNAFMDLHDIGDAMARSRLQQPVMDAEHITLTYKDAGDLMRELKAIGAHNVTAGRSHALTGRKRLQALKAAYESFRREEDQRLPATYEVLYGHAWAPENGAQTEDGSVHVSIDQLRRQLKGRG